MLLSAEDSRRKSTRFVDVDYDKLMINKKRTIQRTKEITELLENAEFLPDDQAVQVRSARYVAIGCDLKDLDKLDAALRDEIRPAQSAILCVAEVSLTYMDVMAANAVIRWASTLSHGASISHIYIYTYSLSILIGQGSRCSILPFRAVLPGRSGSSICSYDDEML